MRVFNAFYRLLFCFSAKQNTSVLLHFICYHKLQDIEIIICIDEMNNAELYQSVLTYSLLVGTKKGTFKNQFCNGLFYIKTLLLWCWMILNVFILVFMHGWLYVAVYKCIKYFKGINHVNNPLLSFKTLDSNMTAM